jgi:hypothetical protein
MLFLTSDFFVKPSKYEGCIIKIKTRANIRIKGTRTRNHAIPE